MIHTITLNPYIEKRVRGVEKDTLYYEVELITYHAKGVGINVSECLKAYHIDSCAHFLSGSNITRFIKDELTTLAIPYTYLETNVQGNIQNAYYNDEDVCMHQECALSQINDTQVQLFASTIQEQIKEQDVLVLEYNDRVISLETMKKLYECLYKKSEVVICDLHPDYYPILQEKQANVLVVDANELRQQIGNKPLSDTITIIKERMLSLAKIIIYVVSSNDFLFFFEGSVYRVVCTMKNGTHLIHKEAIISGIIKCYLEDGDLKTLSEECLSMSVGTTLSDGLYIPSEEVVATLKTKMNMYAI